MQVASRRLTPARQDVLEGADDHPEHQEGPESVRVSDEGEADREHRREDEAVEGGADELLSTGVGDAVHVEQIQHELLNRSGGERHDQHNDNGGNQACKRVHDFVLYEPAPKARFESSALAASKDEVLQP